MPRDALPRQPTPRRAPEAARLLKPQFRRARNVAEPLRYATNGGAHASRFWWFYRAKLRLDTALARCRQCLVGPNGCDSGVGLIAIGSYARLRGAPRSQALLIERNS